MSGFLGECLATESCAQTGRPQLKQCPFVPGIPGADVLGDCAAIKSTSNSSIYPHKLTRNTATPRVLGRGHPVRAYCHLDT